MLDVLCCAGSREATYLHGLPGQRALRLGFSTTDRAGLAALCSSSLHPQPPAFLPRSSCSWLSLAASSLQPASGLSASNQAFLPPSLQVFRPPGFPASHSASTWHMASLPPLPFPSHPLPPFPAPGQRGEQWQCKTTRCESTKPGSFTSATLILLSLPRTKRGCRDACLTDAI